MSVITLGFWAASGAGGISYWLSTLGGSGSERARSVAIDSDGKSYSFGETNSAGSGSTDFLIAERDTEGAVQWQRLLGGASIEQGHSVAIDSSDNVYLAGDTYSQGAGSNDVSLSKYNSAGTIQWQRILGGTGDEQGNSAALDSADNVYVVGQTRSTGAGDFDVLIAKYNSSGAIQWQRVLGGAGTEVGTGVALDSSDNVLVIGINYSIGAGGQDFLIAKYNSSGTIQWQRVLGGSGNEQGYAITSDSSDNVYVLGFSSSTGAGGDDLLIAKYNSAGTIQWQNVLGGTGNEKGYSVAIDLSDNLYVVGDTGSEGEGGNDFLIAKYNSSGTIQWQRVLGGVGSDNGISISIDPLGDLYVLGGTTSTGEGGLDFLLAKLPSDGSLTGTYELDGVDIVYAASTLTAATSTLTAATSSLTAATSSLTAATSTLTDASASLTSHLVEL
jgi:uncharacterized delta-60 repeat protein